MPLCDAQFRATDEELTRRPRCTAGRLPTRSIQRVTWRYSCVERNSLALYAPLMMAPYHGQMAMSAILHSSPAMYCVLPSCVSSTCSSRDLKGVRSWPRKRGARPSLVRAPTQTAVQRPWRAPCLGVSIASSLIDRGQRGRLAFGGSARPKNFKVRAQSEMYRSAAQTCSDRRRQAPCATTPADT